MTTTGQVAGVTQLSFPVCVQAWVYLFVSLPLQLSAMGVKFSCHFKCLPKTHTLMSSKSKCYFVCREEWPQLWGVNTGVKKMLVVGRLATIPCFIAEPQPSTVGSFGKEAAHGFMKLCHIFKLNGPLEGLPFTPSQCS